MTFLKQIGSRSILRRAGLAVTMTALTVVCSMFIRIPIPATGGDNDFGDVMVFISALVFGPIIGGLSGGFGAAIADIFGFPAQAPFTLIIRGLEGASVGWVASRNNLHRDVIACCAGAFVMVSGYFLAEAFMMGAGIPTAFGLIPLNVTQTIIGAIVGILVARLIRRQIPSIHLW